MPFFNGAFYYRLPSLLMPKIRHFFLFLAFQGPPSTTCHPQCLKQKNVLFSLHGMFRANLLLKFEVLRISQFRQTLVF